MNQVIAIHGWYSDSNYWSSWKKQFQFNGWVWYNFERGYGYIEPSEPVWKLSKEKCFDQNNRKLVICHSLGLHLVPNLILKQASHIILLNSFSRFIPHGRESRSVKKALEGMQNQIGKSTENQMLFKFAKKANKPFTKEESLTKKFKSGLSIDGREKLKTDLDLLMKTSKLPSGFNKRAKVLLINGEKDEILCMSNKSQLLEELNNYLDQEPINWTLEDEGHFIKHPNLINDVINWLKQN